MEKEVGYCNCGKETIKKMIFNNSSMYICEKCSMEISEYLEQI